MTHNLHTKLGAGCVLYMLHMLSHTSPSDAITLPEIVFTDKVINQRCGRVCYLYCIKKKNTPDKFAAIFMLQNL